MISRARYQLFLCAILLLGLTCGARAEDPLTLTATAFASGQPMPTKFAKAHENLSPELRIENVPAKAKSLALIVEDPDAPSGLFTHWVIWNMPATLTSISEGGPPESAVMGTNGFGDVRYDGPSPPSGTHRYFFRLYALDTMLDLAVGSTRQAVLAAMEGHIVGTAKTYGIYAAGQ